MCAVGGLSTSLPCCVKGGVTSSDVCVVTACEAGCGAGVGPGAVYNKDCWCVLCIVHAA